MGAFSVKKEWSVYKKGKWLDLVAELPRMTFP